MDVFYLFLTLISICAGACDGVADGEGDVGGVVTPVGGVGTPDGGIVGGEAIALSFSATFN